MTQAQAKPGKTLLSPNDHTLIMIDHQSQMAFATKSIDAVLLRNNVALVAKTAREFGVSTILGSVATRHQGKIRLMEIADDHDGQDDEDATQDVAT
jgi:nicotinamidase-related amidase